MRTREGGERKREREKEKEREGPSVSDSSNGERQRHVCALWNSKLEKYPSSFLF